MVLSYTIDDFLYIAAPIQLALWLPFSILVDYISLYKTRIILRILARMQRRTVIAAVAILVADFIVYKVIFSAGFMADILASFLWLDIPIDLTGYTPSFIFNIIAYVYTDVTQVENMALFVLFWAGLAPSLWLWLYVAALFVTRALLRSERILTWLRWSLDIEKAPFRSIGAVAAALAFMASVAVLLISAELARISAAA
jgi:hypothetical protein